LNATAAIIILIVWIAVSGSVAITHPSWLSDKNEFLKNFVNHELLAYLGVIVTITLASVANLFVSLLKIEEDRNSIIFKKTKRDLKHISIALILTLVVALPLVVLKPILPNFDWVQALLNSMAVWLVAFSMLLLADATLALFELDPRA
jgi:hypothetical protein